MHPSSGAVAEERSLIELTSRDDYHSTAEANPASPVAAELAVPPPRRVSNLQRLTWKVFRTSLYDDDEDDDKDDDKDGDAGHGRLAGAVQRVILG